MSIDSSDASLVDRIVAEYLERKQLGGNPSVEEYCEQHADQAAEIRSLLRLVDVVDADFDNQRADLTRNLNSDALDEPPETIAHYRIVKEIGRGGMGVVYEAEHTDLGRRVALKVLPPHVSKDDHALKRFVREGKAIAQMHHSNIVPLFEVGEENGKFFLAMQLIEGRSLDLVVEDLAELFSLESLGSSPVLFSATNKFLPNLADNSSSLSSNSITVTQSGSYRRFYCSIARLGCQAAEALSYAHRRGFIHRDVKPSNLILDASGVVWLTDFGLAKSDSDNVTQTGDLVGTLRYMAPERFKGVCSEASDIYGLGLTLYELLAVRPAFDTSDRLTVIRKIADELPPKLHTINSQIPRDLETIVMKAIEKDPQDRYSSAQSLAQDLSNFANDLPISARRSSMFEQLIRWSKKNKRLAAALAIAFVSLFTLAVVAIANSVREKELRIVAVEARKESDRRGQKLEENAIALQRNLYFAEVRRAGDSLGEPSARKRISEVIEKWRRSERETSLLGWEWHFLKALNNSNDILIDIRKGARSADWSPDGERLVIAHLYGIFIFDGHTGELIKQIDNDSESANSVAWHPGGKVLASISLHGVVRFFDVEANTEILRAIDTQDENGVLLEWDGSGEQLAISTSRTVYTVRPFSENSELSPFPCDFSSAAYLSWSPDGKKLASSRWFDNQLAVLDVVNNRLDRPILKATTVRWNDASEVDSWIHSDHAGRIIRYDAKTKSKAGTLLGHSDWARTLQEVDAGRRLLVSAGNDWRGIVWDLQENKVLRIFSGHANRVGAALLSPDGTRVVSIGGDTTWLWFVEQPNIVSIDNSSTLLKDQPFREKQVRCLAWHPDGKWLAAGGWDKGTRVWNVFEKECVNEFVGIPWALDWTADGSKLAIGSKSLTVLDFNGEFETTTVTDFGNGSFSCWSHDDSVLLVSRKTCVSLLAVPSGKEAVAVAIKDSSCPDWHPTKSETFAFLAERAICIFEDGHLRKIETTHLPEFSLKWSPDGRRIAVTSEIGTVTVVDVKSGAEVLLTGHDNEVNDLDWHPNGNRLATASTDGTVRIWDTNTWQETISLSGLDSGVTSVAWDLDGKRLAAGDRTGRIIIWDASLGY